MNANRSNAESQRKRHQPLDPAAKQFNRCTLNVRDFSLEYFRLPRDGRKWRQAARSRSDLLLKLSTYANPDGTFKSEDGKKNFSPSAKKLQRHYAKKTLYRLTNDLRELGLLSWERERKHYGRRTYRIHIQIENAAKHLPDQVSDSREKQVPHSQDQVSPRHLITGVTMGPNPSLESLPSYGDLTEVISVAEDASPNTRPNSDVTAAERAFSAFGFNAPFGHPRFRSAVVKVSDKIRNGNLLEIMESVIVELGGKVPPQWYQAKHSLEGTALENESGERAPATSSYSFSSENLQVHCAAVVAMFEKVAGKHPSIAQRLRTIAGTFQDRISTACETTGVPDVEALEREIDPLDAQVLALLKTEAGEERTRRIRRELLRQHKTYRAKMNREQFAFVETQFLFSRLLREFELPRLSLYYMFSPAMLTTARCWNC